MTHITRILCPVDFSDYSARALRHAEALARWYDARLSVLHVMDMPPPPITEDDRTKVRMKLRRFVAASPDPQLVDIRLREAVDVRREILSQADDMHADLIVMGSHGRSGVERLLLGSVAEGLVRTAPCPTMVVPHGDSRPADVPLVPFERILCPVDFSDGSRRALSYALVLSQEADAELTLLHVIEVPPELNEHSLAATISVDAIRAVAKKDLHRRLCDLVPAQALTYCSVETVVREGPADRQIVAEAADQRADLIVMGVQGRGAIDLLVFGSNTARVTRTAACPVLIVRDRMNVAESGAVRLDVADQPFTTPAAACAPTER